MAKKITKDLENWLSYYSDEFKKLRPGMQYPGNYIFLEEFEKINNENEANIFFGKYGVGNSLVGTSSPFERMQAYELFLYILQTYNQSQFKKIHKGTPYYFIAWTAFQFSNFENSLFYMDAAVSEDNRLQTEILTPSTAFFLLEDLHQAAGFINLHTHIVGAISKALVEFKQRSNIEIEKEIFVNKFMRNIIYGENKYRSVATGLYVFILEYELHQKRIFLRSSEGGSVDTFINHLFKGARVLETILAIKGSGKDLYSLINSLPELEVSIDKLGGGKKTLSDAKKTFEDLKKKENFATYNFATSNIIRNTTGHSILWSDEFDRNTYEILYTVLINSIFWSIYKLWIAKN